MNAATMQPRWLELLRPLADQGNAAAQIYLGVMYGIGRGVSHNYTEAVKWYRLAADQGVAAAQFNLGFMYDNGDGAPQDYTEAMKWYRLAAEQGEPDAQGNIGFLYAEGLGVPQDYVQAHMWLNLAVSRYPASRKELRDRAAKGRDLVAAEMTPAQIAEAQKLAREWKPKPER